MCCTLVVSWVGLYPGSGCILDCKEKPVARIGAVCRGNWGAWLDARLIYVFFAKSDPSVKLMLHLILPWNYFRVWPQGSDSEIVSRKGQMIRFRKKYLIYSLGLLGSDDQISQKIPYIFSRTSYFQLYHCIHNYTDICSDLVFSFQKSDATSYMFSYTVLSIKGTKLLITHMIYECTKYLVVQRNH
jgi:hypothetical protein